AERDALQSLDFNLSHVVGLTQISRLDECARHGLNTILHEGKHRGGYGQRFSGSANFTRQLRAMLHAFGSPLAYQQEPDALQQVSGSIHALGKKYVGLRLLIVDADLAGDK